ncbi:MAG: methyltransferase domain-containing protein [Colwellia sp.]|nr:methyltransferase domain-containing protein [Colwellia sp.]
MKLINYPAMASPPSIEVIDRHVGDRLSPESNVIDPFCGTGRLLFNPREKGHFVTGIDCSPVAVLTARVGHQKNNIRKIEKSLEEIISHFSSLHYAYKPNKDEEFWFSEKVYNDVRKLLKSIDKISSTSNVRRFFWLALVTTVRIVSYIREDEYKTHRLKPEQRLALSPNVKSIFDDSCRKMIGRILKGNHVRPGGYRVIQGDIGSSVSLGKGFDALITSPPYGDSISTVGYGQFARIPLIVLSYSDFFTSEFDVTTEIGSLDTFCLGGGNCETSESVLLPESVQYIKKGPMKKFCMDYFYRLKLVSDCLNEKSLCCFVLADRTYKQQRFPLIDSTISYMENLGFTLLSKDERFLSLKRLPRTMQYINQSKVATHVGMNYETVVSFIR